MKKRIMVRLPNWLGDLVMSSAFIIELAKLEPDAQIEVIVKDSLAPLMSQISGVSKVHSFSKALSAGLPGLAHFGKKLAKNASPIDLFFCLPDSFSSAWMARWSSARVRVGYRKEFRGSLLTHTFHKAEGIHRVEEYLGLLELYYNQPIARSRVHFTAEKLPSLPDVLSGTPFLIVNLNSEAQSRRFPVAKAQALLDQVEKDFPNHSLVLIGGPTEMAFIADVLDGVWQKDRFLNLAGQTSLLELTRLLQHAKGMISTDSGPAHLANAFDTPLLVLFGAGNEHNTEPFNLEKRLILRQPGLPCAPCMKNSCRFGDPKCLVQLDEAEISQNLSRLMSASE